MQRLTKILITFFILSFVSACSTIPTNEWYKLIPENSTFVVVPDEAVNVQDIIAKEYASYLDDMTPSGIQQVAGLGDNLNTQLIIKALVLNPVTSTDSELLYIIDFSDNNLKNWASNYYQPFTQNNYRFHEMTIHRLFFNRDELYAAQIHDNLILSKSSLLIENAIRSYVGESPAIKLNSEPPKSSLVLNTPKLDKWIEQYAQVSSRPGLMNSFSGTAPAIINTQFIEDTTANVELTGTIPLLDNRSILVDAFSFENKPITLDRHIASNVATFAIMRLPATTVPAKPKDSFMTSLDSLLLNDVDRYQEIANTLSSEFAFESFPESGLLEEGEYLFMRKISNLSKFRQEMFELNTGGFIDRQDNTYQVSSRVLGELIGSELSNLRDFYLTFSSDVAVIAKRKGLAESVNSDRIRRRVIYYEDIYSSMKDNMPEAVSGFVWTDSNEFLQYITPYLKSETTAGGILSRFDLTAMTFTASSSTVDLKLNTFSKEGVSVPYEELWVVPLSNSELSGTPVLGDLVGSSADEIVVSTQNGRVLALAMDGTIVMETSTDGLEPIGSPTLYDWYGNNQQIVLQAAGSKIFAWNENGNLLPRFPIELEEQISAPILVQDVLRNGVPEIVVATQDRKIHVLDGRGDNVRGWPQNTNAVVNTRPSFSLVDDLWSLWAFSENTLHSWLRNGNARPGYPLFINAPFTGSPLHYKNQVLAGASDGYIYSIGTDPIFADSLASIISEDSLGIRSLYVSNNEISSLKVQPNVLLKDSTGFYNEDLIITESTNGSIFLYNEAGKLRYTKSLGQPASSTFSPIITDINADLNREVLALAEFGRLFAWEILTDKRLFSLPTSGMKHVLITDINGDGLKELIAQTREGLRSWTINKQETDQAEAQ
ncbi:hypothetical protein ACKGJO_09595 [Gracilimonas sp. Q87]|uniref:hypothetical protein n=1 Tax=Gracilimonas sp. Q87 TaxID=3384766 RepID=UPI003983F1B3